MPSCVVKCCKINSSDQHKIDGITFHRFPLDKFWKCRWVEVIRECRNENEWTPSNSSIVCSLHFKKSDLYLTKGGLRRVVKEAIPTKDLGSVTAENEAEVSTSNEIQSNPMDPLIKEEPEDSPSHTTSHMELFTQIENDTPSGSVMSSGNGVWFGPQKIEKRSANISISVIRYEEPETQKNKKHVQEAKTTFSTRIATSPSTTTKAPSSKETYRELQLKEKLKDKDAIIESSKKKIKILQQNVRRLSKRNKLLKHMLKALKKQTDLYTKLNGIETEEVCAKFDMEAD